jgi:hypothetical protein
MARQLVGIGSSANDGTGDTLRDGIDKVNDNFIEIYGKIGNGTTIGTFTTTGITSTGDFTINGSADIILDADGGDIFFKDGATTFGSATNTSGNLIIKSGTTTNLTMSGANITSAGVVTATGFTIGSAAILEAELEIIDGATITTTELNLLDGGTSVGSSITLADADGFIVNDAGTMKSIPASDIKTYTGTSTPAADDIQVGNAAVTITTSSGNITLDAAANNTDIIFKGTDDTADITMLTLDGSEAGAATFNSTITGTALTVDDVVIDGKVMTMTGSTSDTVVFTAGTDGTLSIVTTDAAAAAANIQITADGTAELAGTTVTLDSGVDIVLDADGGDIFFKDAGTTFGSATNTAGNLIVKSGTTTALTFSGANVTAAGTIGSGAITSTGVITGTGFTIGSAAILEAELEIIDGATITTTELNLLDGNTSVGGSITLADADGIIVNDAGTMKTIPASDIKTYINASQMGTQHMWIPSAAMRPTSSNGCPAITDVETTAGRPDMQVLDFDASSDEHAQFQVAMPSSWNEGTITFQVYWTTTATDTDGVAWGFQGVAIADNDTIDVAYGTAIVVTDDALGAAEDLMVTAASGAVTIAGSPAAGELCAFRIFRDVSDGNDDMAEDARLVGIKVIYTTNAATD